MNERWFRRYDRFERNSDWDLHFAEYVGHMMCELPLVCDVVHSLWDLHNMHSGINNNPSQQWFDCSLSQAVSTVVAVCQEPKDQKAFSNGIHDSNSKGQHGHFFLEQSMRKSSFSSASNLNIAGHTILNKVFKSQDRLKLFCTKTRLALKFYYQQHFVTFCDVYKHSTHVVLLSTFVIVLLSRPSKYAATTVLGYWQYFLRKDFFFLRFAKNHTLVQSENSETQAFTDRSQNEF